MCIAILNPKGTEISAQSFRNCWDNNYNGAGFMYNDDNNKLHVVKEMESYDKIYRKYKKLRKKFPNATFVIHFRISTHGVITRANCHPFKVNNELGFVHNGQIKEVSKSEVYSDTNVFNREILRNLPSISIDLMNNPAMQSLITNFIGYSKLIFMDNMGKYSIVKEDKGVWDEKVWYSNESYKRVSTEVDFGGKTVTREELKRLQGGSATSGTGNVYGGRNEHDGYGLGYNSSYDQDSEDYGMLGGSILDEHDGRSPLNSRVGASYGIVFGRGYLVADGTVPCQSCGSHSLTGELMSIGNECLECVTQKESVEICSAAVDDGANLDVLSGTVCVSQETEAIEEEDIDIVECDNCMSVVDKRDSLDIEGWETTLCRDCCNVFINEGVLDESYRFEDAPTEANELPFEADIEVSSLTA